MRKLVGYAKVAQMLNVNPTHDMAQSFCDDRLTKAKNNNHPMRIYPSEDSIIAHLAFALKHEDISLFLLSVGLKSVSEQQITDHIQKSPTGQISRKLGFLWEAFNEKALAFENSQAPYVSMFDSGKYITGASKKDKKWRVDFNGLGDINWCPVVRKTDPILSALSSNPLSKFDLLMSQFDKDIIERSIRWSYLSETKGSFAIERETPTHQKEHSFLKILTDIKPTNLLTEDFLVDLQNQIISNPIDQACFFRHQQNWLQRGDSTNATAIDFVPPSPVMLPELMHSIMNFSNNEDSIDPIIKAAITSFSFVYAHPFMDGNGRLSRYLIHHELSKSEALKNGMILPVSMAILENEDSYFESLSIFSKPARSFCDVGYNGEGFDFIWSEHALSAFSYPDLTHQAEFLLDMINQAIDVNLKQEMIFLNRLDKVIDCVSKEHDLRSNYLNELVISALNNDGKISKNKRRKFSFVNEEIFQAIEDSISETVQMDTKLSVIGTVTEEGFTGFSIKDKHGEIYEIPYEDHDFSVGDRLIVSIESGVATDVKKVKKLELSADFKR